MRIIIKKDTLRKLQLYFSSLLLYSLALFIYKTVPYYQTHVSVLAFKTMFYLLIGYIFCAPFYYHYAADQHTENKQFMFVKSVVKYIKNFMKHRIHTPTQKEQKVAYLFVLVKFFFLPIMLNFFYSNLGSVINNLTNEFFWYGFTLSLFFMIDTFIFGIGYTFEFKKLKNVVRSVEPTFLGWFVALISYPPFNNITGNYIPWGSNDYVLFWNPTGTMLFRIILVVLLAIYVSATISLGFKASNLTNRGIVSRFPYSIVRHPAYISKVMVWWIALLPVLSLKFALGMLFWTGIYFLRAITEERHLNQDPEYIEYCKKVKYRFIPWVV